MGLLRALFGPTKPPKRPYVDDGLAFTKKLVELLELNGWSSGNPEYTEAEWKAIQNELASFQGMAHAEAKKAGAKEMAFHPEAIGPIQRTLCAEALRSLAGPGLLGSGWDLDDECPDDWKARVSTYLKAWAMDLDPDSLLELAPLLALAGYKFEGRQAAGIVAAWFPSYAPAFFAGNQKPELVSGMTERARSIMQDISRSEQG